MIKIETTSPIHYRVTITGDTETTHNVTLSQEYCQLVTQGKAGQEDLIRASFRFLLDQEDNTSILRNFDLPVIEQYFPDYQEAVQKYL